MAADRGKKEKHSNGDLVEWFTVSYRTLYIAGAILIALTLAGYWYLQRGKPGPVGSPVDPGAAGVSARFAQIEGTVLVKVAGSLRWANANPSMVLNKADLVRTGASSSAEIRFVNGVVFHVRPDSVFVIEETFEDPASKLRRTAVKIQSGEVVFQVPQRSGAGSATTISTPTVRTTAEDEARGNVNVSRDGVSAVRVFAGTVQGETVTGERVTLNANEGLNVDAQGKAGPKIALPVTPSLVAPPAQADIAYDNPAEATTLLSWKGVPGATAYYVMVGTTPAISKPVVELKSWQPLSMELRGLEVGTYFWRVAAVGKDGVAGGFSDTSRFAISQGPSKAPTPLSLEPMAPKGNTVQVKGRTQPGAALTVNGQVIDVRPDGSFNEFLSLAPGPQEIVVRATGTGGAATEQRRNIVVPD
jgi:hypothetical protein